MSKTMRTACLALVATCLIALPIGTRTASAEPGDEVWTLQEKDGGYDLVELLQSVGHVADVSFMYDPNSPQVRGRKIQFEGDISVPRDKVFGWFQSVLFMNRCVLAQIGLSSLRPSYSVRDLNDPSAYAHPVYVHEAQLESWKDRIGVYIVTTITVKNLADTSRARNALAQLSTRQVGRVNDVPSSRSFVVADFAPVVHSMWKAIQAMDKEPAPVPAPRVMASPRVRGAPTGTSKQARISYYEKLLAESRTAAAAQHFLNRIQQLEAAK